jgi:methionyl-tRNA formyltransferase
LSAERVPETPSRPLRTVFCGTPEFAVPTLRRLIAEPEFQVEAVVTQPDRPRGRGQHVSASPVKEVALEAGVYVFQPESIKSESALEFFTRLQPDAVVIIAYGQIVPAPLLEIPRLGWINLHASMLPKYRGAAPINWAIIKGDHYTGISTMQVDAGMDTGAMLIQQPMQIGEDETAPQLASRMAHAGAPLVMSTLVALDRGAIIPRDQNHEGATRAPILKKQHGLVDWTLPAQEIYDRIRGLAPWPGAYSYFRRQICHVWGKPMHLSSQDDAKPGSLLVRDGELIVACGRATALRAADLQLEGRKRVTAREFLNGARLAPEEAFSSAAQGDADSAQRD